MPSNMLNGVPMTTSKKTDPYREEDQGMLHENAKLKRENELLQEQISGFHKRRSEVMYKMRKYVLTLAMIIGGADFMIYAAWIAYVTQGRMDNLGSHMWPVATLVALDIAMIGWLAKKDD